MGRGVQDERACRIEAGDGGEADATVAVRDAIANGEVLEFGNDRLALS